MLQAELKTVRGGQRDASGQVGHHPFLQCPPLPGLHPLGRSQMQVDPRAPKRDNRRQVGLQHRQRRRPINRAPAGR